MAGLLGLAVLGYSILASAACMALIGGAGITDRAFEDAVRQELNRLGEALEQLDLTGLTAVLHIARSPDVPA